jgi:hypothetical protein
MSASFDLERAAKSLFVGILRRTFKVIILMDFLRVGDHHFGIFRLLKHANTLPTVGQISPSAGAILLL